MCIYVIASISSGHNFQMVANIAACKVQPPEEVLRFLHLDEQGGDNNDTNEAFGASNLPEDCASDVGHGGDDESTTDAALASPAACGSQSGSRPGSRSGSRPESRSGSRPCSSASTAERCPV